MRDRSVPRPPKSDVRKRLRDAVVAEVTEKGIGATSVAAVVTRAKVSTGTVYLHFKNKDDMLRQVYLEIKTEIHTIMVAARSEPTSAAMIRRMWIDMFRFVQTNPNDFLYLEFAGAAHVLTDAQQKQVGAMEDEVADMLQTAIDDRTLAPLPVSTVIVLLVSPVMMLARMSTLKGIPISSDTIDLTFERVWRSIENTPLKTTT